MGSVSRFEIRGKTKVFFRMKRCRTANTGFAVRFPTGEVALFLNGSFERIYATKFESGKVPEGV